MEKIIAALVIFALCLMINPVILYFSWNHFAVDVLGMKVITYWQSFSAIMLIGSIFGSSNIGKTTNK